MYELEYITLSAEKSDIFISIKGSSALAAASFFGFLAFLAYGLDNFFTFAVWKAETRTCSTVANADANEPNTAPA